MKSIKTFEEYTEHIPSDVKNDMEKDMEKCPRCDKPMEKCTCKKDDNKSLVTNNTPKTPDL